MNRTLLAVAVGSLLGLAWAQDGKTLYQNNCAGCHGAQAQGIPGAFPPLAANPRMADEAYVLKVIRQGLSGPLEVAGQTYNGVMPPMAQVSEADAKAIVAYLKGLAGGSAQAEPAAPAPAPTPQPAASPAPKAGQAAVGRALFTGQKAFAKGGAPCMACHNAGDLGPMGGGSLGKDLTDLYLRLGEVGIKGTLSNIAFPVMREAYKGKPLTEAEIDALVAFFAQASKEGHYSSAVYGGRMWYAAVPIALALFGVMALIWLGRRPSLAERLRRRRA
ncbi:cytochrome c [Calidithermus timidus]|jgi:ubiquinol-cytochrome c reductase cytochrome c subunit|uniref:cytochrome c n=1 Tax=Calidithermus timidus TaxID=307124 RepID=UPI00039DDBE4|nr:cytochrome c [Calidithermus timidus]